jgi:hypothetical protein
VGQSEKRKSLICLFLSFLLDMGKESDSLNPLELGADIEFWSEQLSDCNNLSGTK